MSSGAATPLEVAAHAAALEVFDEAEVARLSEPVQRHMRAAIALGTPLSVQCDLLVAVVEGAGTTDPVEVLVVEGTRALQYRDALRQRPSRLGPVALSHSAAPKRAKKSPTEPFPLDGCTPVVASSCSTTSPIMTVAPRRSPGHKTMR